MFYLEGMKGNFYLKLFTIYFLKGLRHYMWHYILYDTMLHLKKSTQRHHRKNQTGLEEKDRENLNVMFCNIFSHFQWLFLFTFTKCRNHFLLPCIWSLMLLPQLSTIQACSWIGIIKHFIQIWTSWCFRATNTFPSIPWTLFPHSDHRRVLFNSFV